MTRTRTSRPKQIAVWLSPEEHARVAEAYEHWAARRGERNRSKNTFYVSKLVPKVKEDRNGMAAN